MTSNFYTKYIKYKSKYVQLKNTYKNQSGGLFGFKSANDRKIEKATKLRTLIEGLNDNELNKKLDECIKIIPPPDNYLDNYIKIWQDSGYYWPYDTSYMSGGPEMYGYLLNDISNKTKIDSNKLTEEVMLKIVDIAEYVNTLSK